MKHSSLLYICNVSALLLNSDILFAQEEPFAPAEQVAETIPEHLSYLYDLTTPESVRQQLFAGKRLWPNHETLKVCFYGGDSVVRTLIATVAVEWNKYANVNIDFGEPNVFRDCKQTSSGYNAVRIGFGDKGYWSAIGTDSRYVFNQYQPSMNYQWMDLKYSQFQVSADGIRYSIENVVDKSEDRDHAVILHEFGHALGLLHEHQNPNLGCQEEIRWVGPDNVYQFYYKTYRWNASEVDRNLGEILLADPDYVEGEADPESIMIYAHPPQIFIKGVGSPCYVPETFKLSEKDKEIIAVLYPANASIISDSSFVTQPRAFTPTVAASPQSDRIERIRVDLSSDETSIRREARRLLAVELENGPSSLLVDLLTEIAADPNYRDQLGFLVAIDKASSIPAINADQAQAIKENIDRISIETEDDTLRKAAIDASIKLGIE